jgi:hypothetical protein
MALLMVLVVDNNLSQHMALKMIKEVCGSLKKVNNFPFVKLAKKSNVEMSLDFNIFKLAKTYTLICSNLLSQTIKRSVVLANMVKVRSQEQSILFLSTFI